MIKYEQISEIPSLYLQQKLQEFLNEDSPTGDITTEGTVNSDGNSKAEIIAKEDLVISGLPIIAEIFENTAEVKLNFKDGDKVKNGEVIGTLNCNTSDLLRKERVLLNLLQRMSGIATLTKKYTEIATPHNVLVLDTRKTTPGLRLFEKYSVVQGGGQNHRFDLSSGILIKDNHITASGGIKNAIANVKQKNYDVPIQIEVTSIDGLKESIDAGVDGVLLDNMSPEKCEESFKFVRLQDKAKNLFIEASGGITLDNLKDYVVTGIDAVSSGALTHSVKSADISLNFIN